MVVGGGGGRESSVSSKHLCDSTLQTSGHPRQPRLQGAYVEALQRYHGPTLRMISQGVLRVIPASRQAVLDKIGVEPDLAHGLMKRWATAVQKHRKSIEKLLGTS